MDTTETLKELLKLAHESLDSKDAKIAKLKKSDVKWLDLVVKLGENAVEMESKIAELEKTLRDIEHAVRNENELLEMQNNQDIRDLEQQAKGVNDFANKFCGDCKTLEQSAVSYCADSFVKALKEKE